MTLSGESELDQSFRRLVVLEAWSRGWRNILVIFVLRIRFLLIVFFVLVHTAPVIAELRVENISLLVVDLDLLALMLS